MIGSTPSADRRERPGERLYELLPAFLRYRDQSDPLDSPLRALMAVLERQYTALDRDIAGLADQRAMTVPKTLAEPLLDLVRRVLTACEQAERVIDELDELVETGFRGREVSRVEEMIDELSRIESDTDELAERVQRRLFAMEAELGVGTVFWYQMITWVADLADYAERVGNRLRLLIAT